MVDIIKASSIEEYKKFIEENGEGLLVLKQRVYDDIKEIIERYKINLLEKEEQNETEDEKIKNVIFCFEDDEWYDITRYYSILTNSELIKISKMEEIFSYLKTFKRKFITVCGRPEKMTPSNLEKMQKYQVENWGTDNEVYFGAITARDLEMLSFITMKMYLYRKINRKDKSMIIDRLDFNLEKVLNTNNRIVLGYKNATTDNIENYLNEEMHSHLTVVGHGRDDIVWMTKGSLCARSKYCQSYNDSENLPSCAFGEGCFRDEMNVMPMWKLNVRNTFISSCFSLKTNESLFGLKYSLLYSALDGTIASFIGSPHIVDGSSFLNYLYIALIRSGFRIGEISAFINQAYLDYGFGCESGYFVIGDPSYKEKCYESPVKIEWVKNEESYGKYYVADCNLIIIDLGKGNLVNKFFSGEIRVVVSNDENQKLYGVLRYSNNKTYLYLFSSEMIKAGNIYVSIKNGELFDFSQIEKLEYLCAQYERISQEVQKEFRTAKQMGLNLCAEKKESFFIISNTKKLYSRYNNYLTKINLINYKIAKLLNDLTNSKGFSFGEHCLSNGMQFDEYVKEGTCNNCGREIYVFRYKHIMYKNLERIFHMCPICGYILDYSGDSNIEIYFVGDSKYNIGQLIEQKVYIRNNSNVKISGYGGIRLVSGQDMGAEYSEELFPVEVAPKDEKVYSTSIRTNENLKPHSYWLKGTFSIDNDVRIIKKDLWLIK
ncbi:hypothetical protein Clocel_3135 [Clostridium cellulovorans 743B]|uniref:Uncharacterized protein n=2 Tax=Clostridium cellulovorans TaxID=1493 RepID=D9SU69_CLOC7|nr:hypothetical protein Clocel_3135 [Clostridium cellulovorans 743B]